MIVALCVTLLGTLAPTVKVTVDGDGYLRFAKDGRVVYAKSASLTVVDGRLSHESGVPVAPTITCGANPSSIEVDLEGNVKATLSGKPQLLGRLVLAVFTGTQPTADASTFLVASARPSLANPGEGVAGVIRMSGSPSAPVRTEKPVATNEKVVTQSGTAITVRPLSEVDDRQFTLGEIADIKAPNADALAAVIVGESPAIGVERGIDKIRIQGRLRMAGINPTAFEIQVPANAKVIRKAQKVTNAQFTAKATEAAANLAPNAELKCTTNLGDMSVPNGSIELIAERTSQNGSNISVTVAVMVDGKRFNSRTLNLVAAMGAGQVKNGAAVRIRVVSNGAVVEVSGRTKGNAMIGGTVEVVTNPTAQMPSSSLTGILKEAGLVEVKL